LIRALGLALVLLACPMLYAQFDYPLGQRDQLDKSVEVRELVAKYCRADYEGARLNAQDWPKLEPLVWWKSNPDFTEIKIISRYTVESEPSQNHGKFNVSVQYRLLGSFDLATGFIREPANAVQQVDYTVSAVNSDWRIADADNPMPHPSRAAAVKWLNAKISTMTDPATKKIYEDALRQLQPPSPPPTQ